MKKKIIAAVVIALTVFCYSGLYAIDMGAENIMIKSGKKKSVNFAHKKHQTILKDCNICHATFPQEADVIQKMIGEGKLKKKTVMDQCRGCHKKMKKAGEKTGPTSCASCHSG